MVHHSPMPTYQDRDGRIRAIIRLKGHPGVSKTFRNKTLARQWATRTEAAMLDGDFFDAGKITVRSLIERYINEVDCDRWTRNRLLRLNNEESWVDAKVRDVEQGLADWLERRRKQVKPNTVLRESTIISAVFTRAMRRWRVKLKVNPMRDLEKPPKAKPRNRRVKPAEIAGLWTHFGKTVKTTRSYVPWMFEFACETGMRLGEIAELEWEDVNLEQRWAYVANSKNGDARHALLTERAIELLKGLPRPADRVFPVNKGSVGTEFRDACKALGFEDLHFHDSRHEACTRLARSLTVMELARVIGHRNLNELLTYYNPTPEELAAKLPGGARSKPPHPSQPTAACG